MNIQIENTFTHRQISNLAIVTGLTLLFFVPYDFLFNGSTNYCLHHYLLDFGCPGCGLTRATYLTLHLNIQEALTYNFAIVGLLPFLLLELIGCRNKLYKYVKHFFLFLLSSIYIYRIAINFNLI